jgi:chorismate dehydratase
VESHTSVALCSIVLRKRFGVTAKIAPFRLGEDGVGVGDDWPETLLLIGDKAVTTAMPEGRYPHQLDLGEAWKELTGLPFVYAVWMCRAGEEGLSSVRSACDVLARQIRRNAMRLPWIVAARSAEHGWDRRRASEYLGRLLRYEVGEGEREAVGAFLREAHTLGLVPSDAHRWAPVERAGAQAVASGTD